MTLRSQDAQPGDLFAALPGASSHGGRYRGRRRPARRGRGADRCGRRALPGPDAVVPVLVHSDPRSVLGGLAATVYGDPSQHLRVIGVTGTSGKTTTTYLVEAGLRAADRGAGLIGTVGIRIDGTRPAERADHPEAPDLQALLAVMVERGVDTVVMEVSSHALTPGPRRRRRTSRSAASPTCRGTTSTSTRRCRTTSTPRHGFSTPESPTHASTSVVCIDDDAGRAMCRARAPPGDGERDRRRCRLAGGGRPYGRAAARRSSSPSTRRGAPRTAHQAARPLQRRQLPAGGRAARRGRGVTRTGRARPARMRVPGRLEPIDRGQGFLALVDYAHKPGALRAVLRDAARSRAPVAWRWCSARAATETRASASRWAGWQPNWPTWWWSPTTTHATRIPPRSASAIMAGAVRWSGTGRRDR